MCAALRSSAGVRPRTPPIAPADAETRTPAPIWSSCSDSAVAAASRPMSSGSSRAPKQRRIAGRIGGRDEHQLPASAAGAPRCAADSCPRPEPRTSRRSERRSRRRARLGSSPAAARAAPTGCPASRRRSGHEPASSSRPAMVAGEQRACVVVREPFERQVGKIGKQPLVAGSANCEERAPPTRPADAGRRIPSTCDDASSSHCASSIRHTSGCLVGDFGQQAQHGEADDEPVRSAPGCNPKATRNARCCGSGKRGDVAQHRRAQLVQRRERKFQLGFDAGDLCDATARRLPRE